MKRDMKLLFVCTGNICRSPTAEAVMRHRLAALQKEHFFHLDSAGIQSYHIGHSPDPRTQSVALARGISMHTLKARQVLLEDFKEFDLLLAMDKSHYRWLKGVAPSGTGEKVKLYLDFAGVRKLPEVPDPYYGETEDFEAVLDLIEHATDLLLTKLGHGKAGM